LSNKIAAFGACAAVATRNGFHVHHGKANTRALLLAKPGIELRHAGFRSVLAAKPDRPTPPKIADHDPIGMALADRNLVDPDDQGTRRARACERRRHVWHLERFDGVPIKRQFLRDIRDRRLSATAADKIGKALGVERVVCQKVEPFLFHLAAATAIDAPHLQLKQYSHLPAGQVTHLPDFAQPGRGLISPPCRAVPRGKDGVPAG
jgi:hypothetical protein